MRFIITLSLCGCLLILSQATELYGIEVISQMEGEKEDTPTFSNSPNFEYRPPSESTPPSYVVPKGVCETGEPVMRIERAVQETDTSSEKLNKKLNLP